LIGIGLNGGNMTIQFGFEFNMFANQTPQQFFSLDNQ